jgi:hypothetical protein
MEVLVGNVDGLRVGTHDGKRVGAVVIVEGFKIGIIVGVCEGIKVEATNGIISTVGFNDGTEVGGGVGMTVGF